VNREAIEALEVELLIEAIRRRHGYDLREYSPASLRRRLDHCRSAFACDVLSDLIPLVLHGRGFPDALLDEFTVNVTSVFRDPALFRSLREHVVPVLRTYPFSRIWDAGCATGEEVVSLAILLDDEGILERCRIYATDVSGRALDHAREGLYPVADLDGWSLAWQQTGGRGSLDHWLVHAYGVAKTSDRLLKHILYTRHNLVTDGSVGEMNAVICRNVLIYFERPLQERVVKLFRESLCRRGFLCLGSRESLPESERPHFEVVDAAARIFRRIEP